MLCLSFTLLALFASVQGRAVNISNTWVLPEEGFPVFYRYFRDRISWYEADAVCQFHHANLVTVDTTAQYDAVRAYLKELDISSAVWVGLIRSNPDGDFTWTDYRGLSGEGYWSSAPDARAAPLCAAADPAADYRWEARACGGPTVASFICELPVPQWALGKDGCMVRALPALTALYLPESAAVQLTADCGLAGVKRVQCTGNVKREDLLKELSCNDEDETSSTQNLASSSMWPATETTFTEQEVTTDELSTTENVVSVEKETSGIPAQITERPTTYDLHTEPDIHTSTIKIFKVHDFVTIPLNKDINLETIHSNDIPQPDNQENSMNNRHFKTVEDSKHFQHRLLHDEMTRLSNLETIFTQPTDHFVPPLVMAKARISDDMTVLSLEEKHAQQIAEQRIHNRNKLVEHASVTLPHDTIPTSISSTPTPTKLIKELEKPTVTPNLYGTTKKDIKSSVPKKYIDKLNNLKAKTWRTIDSKSYKLGKMDTVSTTQQSLKETETATTKLKTKLLNDSDEDPTIDLTVILKEPGSGNGKQIFYSNHTNTMTSSEQVTTLTDADVKKPDVNNSITDTAIFTSAPEMENKSQETSTVTLNHEIIKITVIDPKISSEGLSPVTFEVSTLMPVFNNDSGETKADSAVTTTNIVPSSATSNESGTSTTAASRTSTHTQQPSLNNDIKNSSSSTTNGIVVLKDKSVSSTEPPVTTHETTTEAVTIVTVQSVKENVTENFTVIASSAVTLSEISTTEKLDLFNHTDNFEEMHEHEEHETEMIDDYQSPLLSAANEPLHRPNRSRRPLPPPNRINKFNPFRILG